MYMLKITYGSKMAIALILTTQHPTFKILETFVAFITFFVTLILSIPIPLIQRLIVREKYENCL